jgi:hypothetical protein
MRAYRFGDLFAKPLAVEVALHGGHEHGVSPNLNAYVLAILALSLHEDLYVLSAVVEDAVLPNVKSDLVSELVTRGHGVLPPCQI